MAGVGGGAAPGARQGKAALRARVLRRRAARPAAERTAAGVRLSAVALATPEVAAAETVSAYVAIGSEPATSGLLDSLLGAGKRVLLPVLAEGGELDWAEYDGVAALVTAARGLREPAGPRLGVRAIAAAEALLVPGLAVDIAGVRLGRGGGSYDRALAHVCPATFTAVLVHDDEVLPAVPVEPHDRRVAAALTPSGLRRFGSR